MIREASFVVPRGYDLASSFTLQRVGRNDPTGRLEPNRFAKAGRTPDGLVSIELTHEPATTSVAATAWGPGADWLLARVGSWLGDQDHQHQRGVSPLLGTARRDVLPSMGMNDSRTSALPAPVAA